LQALKTPGGGNVVVIKDKTFVNGAAEFGGFAHVPEDVILELRNVVIEQCSASKAGGALFVQGQVKLYNSVVRRCRTDITAASVDWGLGGGAYVDENALLLLDDSTITECYARSGGGIWLVALSALCVFLCVISSCVCAATFYCTLSRLTLHRIFIVPGLLLRNITL
jgi:hypothetical protein